MKKTNKKTLVDGVNPNPQSALNKNERLQDAYINNGAYFQRFETITTTTPTTHHNGKGHLHPKTTGCTSAGKNMPPANADDFHLLTGVCARVVQTKHVMVLGKLILCI